jgi:hypothetical protein
MNPLAVAADAEPAVGRVLVIRSVGQSARVAAARVAVELRNHHISVSEVDHGGLGRLRGAAGWPSPCLAVLAIGAVGANATELAAAADAVLCPLDVTDGLPAPPRVTPRRATKAL